MRKPTSAVGYSPAAVQLVRAANLYIATKLGHVRSIGTTNTVNASVAHAKIATI